MLDNGTTFWVLQSSAASAAKRGVEWYFIAKFCLTTFEKYRLDQVSTESKSSCGFSPSPMYSSPEDDPTYSNDTEESRLRQQYLVTSGIKNISLPYINFTLSQVTMCGDRCCPESQ